MGFCWGKCVKIFDRGTTGDAKIEILRGGKTGDCRQLLSMGCSGNLRE